VDIVFTIRTYTTLFKVALSFPINQHTYTIISASYEGIRIEFK